MHEILMGLKEAAPAILAACFTGAFYMVIGAAVWAFMLIYVVPRIQGSDPGGWPFLGAICWAYAFVLVLAGFGVGKASETIGMATIAAVLGVLSIPLLGYKSVKVRAENQQPPAPPTPVVQVAAAGATAVAVGDVQSTVQPQDAGKETP